MVARLRVTLGQKISMLIDNVVVVDCTYIPTDSPTKTSLTMITFVKDFFSLYFLWSPVKVSLGLSVAINKTIFFTNRTFT